MTYHIIGTYKNFLLPLDKIKTVVVIKPGNIRIVFVLSFNCKEGSLLSKLGKKAFGFVKLTMMTYIMDYSRWRYNSFF